MQIKAVLKFNRIFCFLIKHLYFIEKYSKRSSGLKLHWILIFGILFIFPPLENIDLHKAVLITFCLVAIQYFSDKLIIPSP